MYRNQSESLAKLIDEEKLRKRKDGHHCAITKWDQQIFLLCV